MSIQDDEYLITQIEIEEKIEAFLDTTRLTFESLKGLEFETDESKARLQDWSYGAFNMIALFGSQLDSMSPSNPSLISKVETLAEDFESSKLVRNVLV